jgi:stage II sporulation protein D
MAARPRRRPILRAALVLFVAALGGCLTSAPPPVAPAPPQEVPTPPPTTPTPPPVVSETPTPTPSPVPAPTVPTEFPARADLKPPLVRVLLTAGAGPVFPELGRRFACITQRGAFLLRGPLAARVVDGRTAIQVGAFADATNAQAALERLRAAGIAAELRSTADSLWRLVALSGAGEGGEALAQRLAAAGFTDQQRLGAAQGSKVTVTGEGGAEVSGERVLVVPVEVEPAQVWNKRLRGEFELRPGADGLAVIDVLNLEEYLRGVVPAEMGPRVFPALEALKAQAVAARTYAVSRLGSRASDGYDLCDSQLCQVFEGAGVEQPLTDRAVSETAGEIITYRGAPIDAMYHSTCAGHTEDGAAVFPALDAPYLKGVVCTGERILTLGTGKPTQTWLDPLARLDEVGRKIAVTLGVPPRAGELAARLSGVRIEPSGSGLLHVFGLDKAVLLLRAPPSIGSEEVLRRLLELYRLPLPETPSGTPRTAIEMAMTVRVAQLAGRVQAVSGRLLSSPPGVALVPDDGGAARPLTGAEEVVERRGERWRVGLAQAPAGSPATLWCAAAVCPLLEVEPLASADAASAWNWWSRELSLADIGRRLGIPAVRAVRVLRRGVSGRALAVAVISAAGTREIAGLPFRRALDLPDTLFVVVSGGDAGRSSLRFVGRGWGHGVGMCQNGAYGLARGGASYVEILKTYYTGVEVGRWEGEKP